MAESAILRFNGQEIELPVIRGSEDELAIDISKLRAQTGLITLDYGYVNTGVLDGLSNGSWLERAVADEMRRDTQRDG